METEKINEIMEKFHNNKNEIGLLYNEYTIKYGKEYYLSSLADNILKSLHTFETFYTIVEEKEVFANMLLDLSLDAIELLKINTKESLGKMSILKKRRITKKEHEDNLNKIKQLLNKIDQINEFITKNCENYAK